MGTPTSHSTRPVTSPPARSWTDRARAAKFVDELGRAEIPAGRYRYYDGKWYLMALLHVSGQDRVWTPTGLPQP